MLLNSNEGPLEDRVDQDKTSQNVQSDLDLQCPIRKYGPKQTRNSFKKSRSIRVNLRQIKFNGINQCHEGSISSSSACK